MSPFEKIKYTDYFAVIPGPTLKGSCTVTGFPCHHAVIFQMKVGATGVGSVQVAKLDEDGKSVSVDKIDIEVARKWWQSYVTYGWITDPSLRERLPKYKTFF